MATANFIRLIIIGLAFFLTSCTVLYSKSGDFTSYTNHICTVEDNLGRSWSYRGGYDPCKYTMRRCLRWHKLHPGSGSMCHVVDEGTV